ncbi:MAG: hypothetical protein HQM00_01780 [Magnetococcales bacterium]|nr:hypothetical protein [Magnetococcales bacterium]
MLSLTNLVGFGTGDSNHLPAILWKFVIEVVSISTTQRTGIFEAYTSKDGSGENLFVKGAFTVTDYTVNDYAGLMNVLNKTTGTARWSQTNGGGKYFVAQFNSPVRIHSIRVNKTDEDGYYITSMSIYRSNDGVTWIPHALNFNPQAQSAVAVQNLGLVGDEATGQPGHSGIDRYWRIALPSAQWGRVGYLAELRAFLSSNGTGTNLAVSPAVVKYYHGATLITDTVLNDGSTSVAVAQAGWAGPVYAVFDFGTPTEIHSMTLHFTSGGYPWTWFDVQSSTDGETWRTRKNLASSLLNL